MLNKIDNEIKDFTNNIKDSKGCDDLLVYINTSFYSSIKLLMFASATFSLYARLMLFFVIASAGILLSSAIGAVPVSTTLSLGTTLFFFILIMLYITHFRKNLIEGIKLVKKD